MELLHQISHDLNWFSVHMQKLLLKAILEQEQAQSRPATKRKGKELVCPEKECGYSEAVEDAESDNELAT